MTVRVTIDAEVLLHPHPEHGEANPEKSEVVEEVRQVLGGDLPCTEVDVEADVEEVDG